MRTGCSIYCNHSDRTCHNRGCYKYGNNECHQHWGFGWTPKDCSVRVLVCMKNLGFWNFLWSRIILS